jgi:mono/diheme cytochrome c family protein
MDLQDNEFEGFLKKFRLKEPRPFVIAETPVAPRSNRTWIAAAAVLAIAIGAGAVVMLRQVPPTPVQVSTVKNPTTLQQSAEIPTVVKIPPIPEPSDSTTKLDPKPKDPMKQLTVVVPAPPVETANPAKPDVPQAAVAEPAIREILPSQETQNVAPGPGKAVFDSACGTCHDANLLDGRRGLTREEYLQIVDRMLNYGAGVSAGQKGPLVDFIFSTYGQQKN